MVEVLEIGKKYPVLCWVYTVRMPGSEEDHSLDLKRPHEYMKTFVVPLIDHPHNDVENGQKEAHYHIDYRFARDLGPSNSTRVTIPVPYGELKTLNLKCVRTNHALLTPTQFIRKSKLKHKCIHKGRCPHRGYDLSKEPPVMNPETGEWEIVCPLHSLRFDANSKKLLSKLF